MDINIALVIQLFALLNPLASFPFLLSAYEKKVNVKAVAIKAILVAFLLAVVIVFVGPYLFKAFGINLDSFRIAGGIVLLLLGINMVNAKPEDVKSTGVNGLIAIIATPLLTGPAVISFVTIKAYEIGKIPVLMNICIAFILVALLFIIFSLTIHKINVTVVDITSRVMGLFLCAVSIEMMAAGVEGIIQSVA